MLGAGIFSLGLSGCNDTDICHCGYEGGITISLDWELVGLPEPNNDDQVTITIVSADNTENTIHKDTSKDPKLDLPDGTYTLIVKEEDDDVDYDGYGISMEPGPDGMLPQAPAISAGEQEIVIEERKVKGKNEVLMVPQSRELIVDLLFENAAGHNVDVVDLFHATMDNVVSSRDISQGFPPQTVDRPVSSPVYGSILMEFRKVTDYPSASGVLFRATYRLLGINQTQSKYIVFKYLPDDAPGTDPEFFSFDATDQLAEFHTLEDVKDAYHVQITLRAESVGGGWTITDWDTGTGDDLIAEETK